MGDSARKIKIKLQIVDETGRPLANCQVKFTQKSHKFMFGCGAFEAVEWLNPTCDTNVPYYQDMMEKWFRLFNFATLPFYWGSFEAEEGKPKTDQLLKTAQYLAGRGIALKGHPLCWHTNCAEWLLKYDDHTIFQKQLDRIYRDVSDFKQVIHFWDVINETVIMPCFDRYDNGITRICRKYGRDILIKEVFAAARAADPDAFLLINDFNTGPGYEAVIEEALETGVPINGIGIQSHQHQGYWGKNKLKDVIARFSRFGIPIHFTENTLTSGHLMPKEIVDLNDYQVEQWPTSPEYEIRQMNETEEMFRILWESPAVEAITEWDFADDAWLHAPAGLVRERDNSLKPAYYKLDELINKEWHTEVMLLTDDKGCVDFEGYQGTYHIEAGSRTKDAELVCDRDKELLLLSFL